MVSRYTSRSDSAAVRSGTSAKRSASRGRRHGLDDGELRFAALSVQDAAHGKAVLGPVGQGLDSHGAAQPVEPANLTDNEPLSGAHGRRLS
jgi:hypothetical protein